MKIVALDSSGLVASVAVTEDTVLTAEYTVQYKKTHSQTLLPMLDEIARMIQLDMKTVDAIAVSAGPGSFTGLRIGSATAKGLGLALEKPIIAVSSLEALAYNLYGTDITVCPIMDARREQVYTGVYQFEKIQEATSEGSLHYRLETLRQPCAIAVKELTQYLNACGQSVIFVGDGIPVYQELLQENLQIPYHLAPSHRNRQSAASLAALAFLYYQEGKVQHARDHKPDYLRLSQAERERLAKV